MGRLTAHSVSVASGIDKSAGLMGLHLVGFRTYSGPEGVHLFYWPKAGSWVPLTHGLFLEEWGTTSQKGGFGKAGLEKIHIPLTARSL